MSHSNCSPILSLRGSLFVICIYKPSGCLVPQQFEPPFPLFPFPSHSSISLKPDLVPFFAPRTRPSNCPKELSLISSITNLHHHVNLCRLTPSRFSRPHLPHVHFTSEPSASQQVNKERLCPRPATLKKNHLGNNHDEYFETTSSIIDEHRGTKLNQTYQTNKREQLRSATPATMSPTYTMSAHLCKQIYSSWRQTRHPSPEPLSPSQQRRSSTSSNSSSTSSSPSSYFTSSKTSIEADRDAATSRRIGGSNTR